MERTSQLDAIIAPEIRDDRFARLLEQLATAPHVRTILEIGSSAGDGSTAALVNGARRNPARPDVFCLKLSTTRFAALPDRYRGQERIHCYNTSSVPASALATTDDITRFFHEHRPKVRPPRMTAS